MQPPLAAWSPSPAMLRLARLWSWAVRARTLPFARRVFSEVTSPLILSRPVLGRQLVVDASRTDTHRLLYLEGERFLSEARLIAPLVRRGDHVVDVGANIGYYLLLWERLVGPGGFVHCIEPEPENLVELERNIEANQLGNVRVHRVALGATDGAVALRPGLNSGVDPTGSLRASLRRLDSIGVERADVLKIDVEGYEGEVLSGGAALLKELRPTIFLEMHPWLLTAGHSVDSLLQLLLELYPRVEAHEAAEQVGGLAVLARYGLRSCVRPVSLHRVDDALRRRQRPFWILARARP